MMFYKGGIFDTKPYDGGDFEIKGRPMKGEGFRIVPLYHGHQGSNSQRRRLLFQREGGQRHCRHEIRKSRTSLKWNKLKKLSPRP